ncbi:MAG: hypothetical protein OEU95_08930 [Nitrospirota bacterium]|nr:hypothetical protein [Nitrospirota bacterium]
MLKLFFRTIILILFIIFLVLGLSLWKGGEPFRWIGEGTRSAGDSISKFGDFVDDVITGGSALRKDYDKVKDYLTREKKFREERE